VFFSLPAHLSVQLTNGDDHCSGYLEMYYGNRWQDVSENQWNFQVANVVCRQLDCGFAHTIYTNSSGLQYSSGPVVYSNFSCTGYEHNLNDCQRTLSENSSTSLPSLAGVNCTVLGSIPIRLSNGSDHCSGRVEVYFSSTWGTVSGESWDINDANVMCRTNGCGFATAAVTNSYFGEGAGPVWFKNVGCTGDEYGLKSCPLTLISTNMTSHSNDAGVVCSGGKLKVRLVNGSSPCNGRVEVYYGIQWRSVCGPSWDMNSARVICRELKCGIPRETHNNSFFGRGTGEQMLVNFKCDGRENSLISCTQNWNISPNCTHAEDFSITCLASNLQGDVSMRLVSGTSRCNGVVEVKGEGDWGRVCSKNWDMSEARVFCRQLRCGAAVASYSSASMGQWNGSIWLDEVLCNGYESSVSMCLPTPWVKGSCNSSQVATLECMEPRAGSISVNLVNGSNSCSGRVVVYWQEYKENVLVSGENWDIKDAHVLCRHRHCGLALTALKISEFGRGSGKVFFDFFCEGSETTLSNCPMTSVGLWSRAHTSDAGVICS
uniref:SRCR domain-containing protein n=1 Tax=Latimeria chalumnae TaxID=7897 RepID=H3AVD5_LATCH